MIQNLNENTKNDIQIKNIHQKINDISLAYPLQIASVPNDPKPDP
jgi:hypothetical protein